MKENIIYRQKGLDAHYKIWHKTGRGMIILIHEGTGSIVCSEKTYPMKRGVLCFIGAQKSHYTMPDTPSEYERSKVFIDNMSLQKISELFTKEFGFYETFTESSMVYAQLNDQEHERAEKLFEEIEKSNNEPKLSTAVFFCCCTWLLIMIKNNFPEIILPSDGFINKAIQYINEHISEQITIDGICTHSHVSKYYLCREFKKATGVTVMEYVLKTRIALAKDMLENKSMSVSAVSDCCGFSSVSYFCRAFKKETGKTPLKYSKTGL